MSTADEVRREWWRGYWRMRDHQLAIQREFIIPLAKILAERVIEVYPELSRPLGRGQ